MNKIFTAEVPSNIALLKYWGKSDSHEQWPANDSISMTLNLSKTTSIARRIDENEDKILIEQGTKGAERAKLHLERLRHQLGFHSKLSIESSNSFPSSCGIASSASGFAALTLAALCAWTDSDSFETLTSRGFSREDVAQLARLGSGSAGRSLFGGIVQWSRGDSPERQSISQLWDENHWSLSDIIIVLDRSPKKVSSREAHQAAWHSPLFPPRLAAIEEKKNRMIRAIQDRNLEDLGTLIENEALDMHAVIMTGSPAVQYLAPTTIDFLVWVRQKRQLREFPAWFTIDAGPNIHLLCEQKNAGKIIETIREGFDDIELIDDYIGGGPRIKVH